jgi:hypothetical protein
MMRTACPGLADALRVVLRLVELILFLRGVLLCAVGLFQLSLIHIYISLDCCIHIV